jgi:hypothetical protein
MSEFRGRDSASAGLFNLLIGETIEMEALLAILAFILVNTLSKLSSSSLLGLILIFYSSGPIDSWESLRFRAYDRTPFFEI